jgi:aryl-alcohol dehydrogenase-like predicted oxidoreductase
MMRYIHISGIDQPVSVLGLGTATRVFAPESYSQAAELIDAFLAAGGNCIDAAHIYGFGASEKTLGRWLRERGTRGQVVLITKGGHPFVDPQNLFGQPWEPRVTPEAIHADLAESLERLEIDTIDLYLLHRDDENVPVGPLVQALNAEQADGRIRAFGASNWSVARIEAANTYAKEHGLNGFVISSPQYSLARPARMYFPGTISASAADLAWHAREQFPMLAFSALSAGFVRRFAHPATFGDDPIAQTYETEANVERMRRAQELAERKGTTLAQIALAYVLHTPFPTVALIGPATRAHLDELLGSVQVTLDDAEMAYLEQRSKL